MADASLTTFFFNWLNFVVLIGLGIYAFKKYLLPSYTQQLAQEEVSGSAAQEQYKMLTQQHSNALRTLQQQKELIAYLDKQVSHWQEHVRSQEKLMHTTKTAHFKKIKEKRIVQEINRSEQVRLAKALPNVFEQASTALVKQFTDPTAQQSYLDTVLKTVRR